MNATLATATRRTLALLAAIILAATMLLGVRATPARAIEADCKSGQICLWYDYYGWGKKLTFYTTGIRGGERLLTVDRRKASSGKNMSPWSVRYYLTINCNNSRAYVDLSPGQYISDLGTRFADNAVSSVASYSNGAIQGGC